MILADSGSTKSDWVRLEDGVQVHWTGPGLSPTVHSLAQLRQHLRDMCTEQSVNTAVKCVYFYGTGCAQPERMVRMVEALQSVFADARIEVESDLLGAARATCGRMAGIACILGTGSNSCVYDGTRITYQTVNLGYLLGDEGSGSDLGRATLQAYYYRLLPETILRQWKDQLPPGRDDLIQALYDPQQHPGQYLARFAPLLYLSREEPAVAHLIRHRLGHFLDVHVCPFPQAREWPVHFVGSIAHYFSDFLFSALEERDLRAGKLLHRPIQALVHFHSKTTE